MYTLSYSNLQVTFMVLITYNTGFYNAHMRASTILYTQYDGKCDIKLVNLLSSM